MKSIPRETPYSLSFLTPLFFFGGGLIWSSSAITSERLLFKSEEFASSSLPALDWMLVSSMDEYSVCDLFLPFNDRLFICSPMASCSSDAMMISYTFLLNSSTT